MTTIAGFTRMVMGDYMGPTGRYFGSCCGCGIQFMSTHDVAYVPTDETRAMNRFRHGPACERCALRVDAATKERVLRHLTDLSEDEGIALRAWFDREGVLRFELRPGKDRRVWKSLQAKGLARTAGGYAGLTDLGRALLVQIDEQDRRAAASTKETQE